MIKIAVFLVKCIANVFAFIGGVSFLVVSLILWDGSYLKEADKLLTSIWKN